MEVLSYCMYKVQVKDHYFEILCENSTSNTFMTIQNISLQGWLPVDFAPKLSIQERRKMLHISIQLYVEQYTYCEKNQITIILYNNIIARPDNTKQFWFA